MTTIASPRSFSAPGETAGGFLFNPEPRTLTHNNGFPPRQIHHQSPRSRPAHHELASDNGQSQVDAIHLLAALLAEQDGIVQPLLEKIGVNRAQLDRIVEAEIGHLPKVSGAEVHPSLSPALAQVLEAAQREAAAMKDDFVSTEHLLLALAKIDSKAKNVFRLNAIDEKKLLEAMKSVRGSARVTDQAPEGKFQALQKYGIDLVQRASKASSIR